MISRIFFHELDRQYKEIVLEILIGLRVLNFWEGGKILNIIDFWKIFPHSQSTRQIPIQFFQSYLELIYRKY